MRKLIMLIGATTLALGGLIASPAAPPADAHQYSSAAVCFMGEIGFFGPEPNEVGILRTTSFHFYGLSYHKCCYWSLRYGFNVMAMYLEGWDEWSWPTGDPWCPGS